MNNIQLINNRNRRRGISENVTHNMNIIRCYNENLCDLILETQTKQINSKLLHIFWQNILPVSYKKQNSQNVFTNTTVCLDYLMNEIYKTCKEKY